MKSYFLLFVFTVLLINPSPTNKMVKNAISTKIETVDKKNSWKLFWEESFSGKELDTANWNIIQRNTADWGNYMSNNEECIKIRNGNLYLRGIVNPDRTMDTVPYLTGGVSTKSKFAFQYGKIVVRAKLENATGAWPALWMLADNPKYGNYPRNGEIDLMEHLNYEDQVYQTIHSYYTLELKKEVPQRYTTVPVNPERYNTYGMEWFPDRLVFTLNGMETLTYPRLADVDPSQWPFDQPFYIMLDMQLGGSWVGNVDPLDLPVQMIIDWVKVYKEKNTRPR